MGLVNHMDEFDKDITEMEKLADREAKVKGTVDNMKFTKTKTSAIEHTKEVASFGKATTKKETNCCRRTEG